MEKNKKSDAGIFITGENVVTVMRQYKRPTLRLIEILQKDKKQRRYFDRERKRKREFFWRGH